MKEIENAEVTYQYQTVDLNTNSESSEGVRHEQYMGEVHVRADGFVNLVEDRLMIPREQVHFINW